MIFRRFFHSTILAPYYSSSILLSNQSLLATLRKKTGYSIGNCKKALDINGNDLNQAEKWLNEQAQSQGWAKAAKLQNRATLNGLVGVAFDDKKAVIVEVNCETDFVGRNEKFQTLVSQVAETCLANIPTVGSPESIVQFKFSSEQMGALKIVGEGKTLADLVALNIGQIGENMSLRRAAALCVSGSDLKLACCTHPLTMMGHTFLGKYGAVVAFAESAKSPAAEQPTEATDIPEGISIDKLPRQLCQHIIGMNPISIERKMKDPTEESADPKPAEDGETILVEQEFVANPEYRVGEILDMAGWKVKGILRLECGDSQE